MRKRATASISSAALIAVVTAAAPVIATTIVAKNLGALCQEADIIFVGTVGSVRSQWADTNKKALETLVTFTDVEPLHGIDASDVTLRFGGGQVGQVREVVAGIPRFEPGQRFVIFARRQRAVSPIVGFNQGCLRVVQSPAGATVQTFDGQPLRLGAGGVFQAQDSGTTGLSLDSFLDMVRRELARHQEPGS